MLDKNILGDIVSLYNRNNNSNASSSNMIGDVVSTFLNTYGSKPSPSRQSPKIKISETRQIPTRGEPARPSRPDYSGFGNVGGKPVSTGRVNPSQHTNIFETLNNSARRPGFFDNIRKFFGFQHGGVVPKANRYFVGGMVRPPDKTLVTPYRPTVFSGLNSVLMGNDSQFAKIGRASGSSMGRAAVGGSLFGKDVERKAMQFGEGLGGAIAKGVVLGPMMGSSPNNALKMAGNLAVNAATGLPGLVGIGTGLMKDGGKSLFGFDGVFGKVGQSSPKAFRHGGRVSMSKTDQYRSIFGK